MLREIKTTFVLFLAVVAFCSCDRGMEPDTEPVDNSIVDFDPEDKFGAFCIRSFDLDSDGQLSVYECGKVREINCAGMTLFDIQGIKNFTNLEALYCHDNIITNLDVSGMSNLKYLYCNASNVHTIDVRGCSNLLILDAHQNFIKQIDITQCPDIFLLSVCFNAELEELDLSNSRGMGTIYCQKCSLRELDLSHCGKLMGLHCWNNQLESINLEGCGRLTDIWCGDNRLRTLDVTQCADRISFLSCPRNNNMNSVVMRRGQECVSIELPQYAIVKYK